MEPDVWVTLQGKRLACLEVLEKLKSVQQVDKVSDLYLDPDDEVRIYLQVNVATTSQESG